MGKTGQGKARKGTAKKSKFSRKMGKQMAKSSRKGKAFPAFYRNRGGMYGGS
jgi:hypothetical protein